MYDRQPFGNIEKRTLYIHLQVLILECCSKKMQMLRKHLLKALCLFGPCPFREGGDAVGWFAFFDGLFIDLIQRNKTPARVVTLVWQCSDRQCAFTKGASLTINWGGSQLGTHDEALVGRSFTWPRLHDKHLHDVTIAWHMIAWQACAWNTFEWQKYRKHDGTKPWHTLTGRRITFTWRHKYMNVTHVTPKNNYMTYDYMT